MEYFDSRGVRRTYGVSLEDGVLRMWREHPGFDQRYSATLAPDAFEGQWPLAKAPEDWQDDLKLSYRRVARDGVRKVVYRDPDGNELGFGGSPPDGAPSS